MHIFYLHGFASSARSSKAQWLAGHLAAHGLSLHCPDLNEPDFSSLTITRMIDRIDSELLALPPAPVVLIGSSLGGFVAVQLAARGRPGTIHPVDRMILLAPALDFPEDCVRTLGADGIARWRATNRLDVFHYAHGGTRPLGFALYEDAQRYDTFTTAVDVPILIFQGRADESVDPEMVRRFARSRPNVTLRLLDDGHQLLGSLDVMWREIAATLGLDVLS
jgi:uncharacterized protein